ncbi:MAG: putative Ig domain-containing protein [Bacteroidota bacterium]|nr:putative Ig domain-containing protein [Bacteroidota bacterium]
MNKLFLSLLLLLSLQAISQKEIYFSEAKFKTGDQSEWKASNFDDSQWPFIKTGTRWEDQGYTRYDGYAWYRIKFILPSSLKQNAYWKDSLSFWLGKIDDVDETFLNGVKIGQTGSLPTDVGGYETQWDTYRIYNIPANSSNIYWDKENTIAIRVYDNTSGGGMFGSIPFVKMLTQSDELEVSISSNTAPPPNYNTSVENISAKMVEGIWAISIKDGAIDKIIRSTSKAVNISGLKKITEKINMAGIAGNKRIEIISSFKEKHTGDIKSKSVVTPYILTPPVSAMPRINSALVFGVRPNSPFIFKIAATGKKPLQYNAENLPEGLSLEKATGIITGKVSVKGNYNIKLNVSNQLGNATQDFQIKVGEELALTPPMGWNSWNCWGLTVDDEKVKSSAQAFIDKGLIDHGWSYINIDDGWQNPERTNAGEIIPNKKFGDIEALGSWLHNKGLKFGIYSSPGTKTCGGYTGSYQHELKDATTYAKWGVDYLKYDWCSYEDVFTKEKDTSLQAYQKPYQTMELALKAQSRDIVYSLCQYGMADVWKWGDSVNGNSWRTTGDIQDTWESVVSNGFDHPELFSYAKPGNWNDPDMLVVGKVGWSGTLHSTMLTPDEQYSHISLWCLLSSPLLIGCDVSKLDDFTLNLLTNDEVLAIDQDILGKQAQQKIKTKDVQIWVKSLADGSKAIGIFNMSNAYKVVRLNFSDIGLKGKYIIRDLWRQINVGVSQDKYESNIPPHGVSLIKLTGK